MDYAETLRECKMQKYKAKSKIQYLRYLGILFYNLGIINVCFGC
jgi:uncharacterized protein (DUF2164 family)